MVTSMDFSHSDISKVKFTQKHCYNLLTLMSFQTTYIMFFPLNPKGTHFYITKLNGNWDCSSYKHDKNTIKVIHGS